MNKLRLKNKKLMIFIVLLVIMMMYIGYALLSQDLTINGNSKISNSTWDIHFDNLNVSSGSVEINEDNNDSAATIDTNDNTKIAYSVSLNLPGDYYEFTVDAKNFGTIDGVVERLKTVININNGTPIDVTTNPSSLPKYLLYSVKYVNGDDIVANQELKSGEKTTYKVRIEYNKDLDPGDLPEEPKNIGVVIDTDYLQSDNNGDGELVNYKVIHKYQLDGDNYRDVVENLRGRPDVSFVPALREEEGYNNPERQEVILKSDGSTVITYVYSIKKCNLVIENSNKVETETPSGEYNYGTSVTLRAKVIDGNEFVGWSNGETEEEITIILTEDTTIYPMYEVNSYYVTFNANGGTSSVESRWVTPNTVIGSLPTASKDSSTFLGWYTSLSGGIKIDSSYIVTGDIELFAKYRDELACTYDGTIEDGTEYVRGQYKYKFRHQKNGDSWESFDYNAEDGWGVDLLDANSTDPITSEMCTTINDIPITSMTYTYYASKSNSVSFDNVDTKYVTNMDSMFRNTHFDSIDVASLDTSSVESMNRTFSNVNMDYLDLTGLDISNVWSMYYIFNDNNIKKLTIDGWDFSGLYTSDSYTYVFGDENYQPIIREISAKGITLPNAPNYLFGIESLETIDLSNITVEDLTDLFSGASSLKNVIGMDTWDTTNLYSISGMFENCSSLTEVDMSSFIDTNVNSFSGMFNGCTSLRKLDLSAFNIFANANDFSGILDGASIEEVIVDNWVIESIPQYFSLMDYFSTVEKMSCRNWVLPEDISNIFYTYDAPALKEIDVTGWDLSNTKNISNLFKSLSNVEKIIGLDTWDTSNITDMSNTFSELGKLKTINGIDNWDTSNVETMERMFYKSGLEEISLNGFEMNKLDNVREMFSECDYLKKLDISNFNIFVVEDNMTFYRSESEDIEIIIDNWNLSNFVFPYSYSEAINDDDPLTVNALAVMLNCHGKLSAKNLILPEDASYFLNDMNFKSVDVTGWNLSSTTNFYSLFSYCDNLEEIIGLDTWDTSNVTNMGYMFAYSSSLIYLDLSGFNTSCVEDMSYMFYSCNGLKELDLSSFNTSSLTNTESMFSNSDYLEKIYASDSFVTNNITSSEGMFSNGNLVGGAGTTFSYYHTDKEYARLDGGVDNPGYFSRRLGIKVTFNPNGGALANTRKYVATGAQIGELPIPTKKGGIFDGWYTNLINGVLVTENTIINEETTFYAKWKKSIGAAQLSKTIINLNVGENETINITNSNEIEEEYTFTSGDPTIATVDSTGKVVAIAVGSTTVTITGNTSNETKKILVTIEDDLDGEKYIIRYNANGGSVSSGRKEVVAGTSVGQLAIPTRKFYIFDGWYTGLTDGVLVEADYIPSDDMTIYARWHDDIKYTVTFDANGGMVSESSRQVHKGDRIGNLPVPNKDGKVFVGWYTGLTSGTMVNMDTIVNDNMDLFAKWSNSVVDSNLPSRINILDGNTAQIEISDSIEYEGFRYASLDERVAKVNDNGLVTSTGLGATSILVTGNTSKKLRYVNIYVTNNQTETFTINFDANGGTVSETTRTVYKNYSVGRLPIPTKENAYFGGWKDANNKYYTCVTTATENTTLYAVWNDTDYAARIDDTYFVTIKEAQDNRFGDIVLLRDVTDNFHFYSTATVNLDGHTLYGNIHAEYYPNPTIYVYGGTIINNSFALLDNANFNLGTSSTMIDDGIVVKTYETGNSAILISSNSTFRLYKGYIEVDGGTGIVVSGYNSSVTINGGTIRAEGGVGISSDDDRNSITFNKGIVVAKTAFSCTFDGAITMNGGRFETTGTAVKGGFTMNGGTIVVDNKDYNEDTIYAVVAERSNNFSMSSGSISITSDNKVGGISLYDVDDAVFGGGTLTVTSREDEAIGLNAVWLDPSVYGGNINVNAKKDAIGLDVTYYDSNITYLNATTTVTSTEGKAIGFAAKNITMNSGYIRVKGNNSQNTIFSSYSNGSPNHTFPSGMSLRNRSIDDGYTEYYVQ